MFTTALSAVALLAAALLPSTALAQTYTNCNPLNTTNCPDMPALGGNATFNFTQEWNPKLWVKYNQGDITWTDQGTSMTVALRGDAPYLQSNFYIFFGRVEVVMKAAPGQGIISSSVIQSDDRDEIDWEFKGGDTKDVFTNYYGKGNDTYDPARPKTIPMSAPQDDFHNYTVDWTQDRTQWWLDGTMIRELKFADALGGANYPQTPATIRIGIWAGGDTKNNANDTVVWAGGETDFSKGPYGLVLKSVYVQDYHTAQAYSWAGMDSSGSFTKIKLINPDKPSSALKEAQKPHGVKNRWAALSSTAKIGILAGVGGAVLLIALLVFFCCIKQRRAGRREHAAYQANVEKEEAELQMHKLNWAASHHRASRYNRI